MIIYREDFTKIQHDAFHEAEGINQWLLDNDYKINKFILGEYTNDTPAWITYKNERTLKLQRLNYLEGIING